MRRRSTDRDHGEGFVLSEYRTASGTGESKHIKTNRVNPGSNWRVKGQLFCMCEYVNHLNKQIVNWVQMYNNN